MIWLTPCLIKLKSQENNTPAWEHKGRRASVNHPPEIWFGCPGLGNDFFLVLDAGASAAAFPRRSVGTMKDTDIKHPGELSHQR